LANQAVKAFLNQRTRHSAMQPASRDSRWCGSRYWLMMNKRDFMQVP
jgi:hypothetical protein